MDSQHRHELQENELAHWLERKIEGVKPHLPLIAIGAVAAAVGAWGFGVYRSENDKARYAAWDSYALAMERGTPNAGVLEQYADEDVGGPAADWMNVTWADNRLYVAAQSYLQSRDTADEAIDEAKAKYQVLRGSRDPRVRNRAVFGLARAAEIMGDLEEAGELYGQVTGEFADLAKERGEQLADPTVIADYAWLKDAKVSSVRASAGPGVPGQVPDFAADLLDTPDDTDADEASPPEAPAPSAEQSLSDILKSYGDESGEDLTDLSDVLQDDDGAADSVSNDAKESASEESAAAEESEEAAEEPASQP